MQVKTIYPTVIQSIATIRKDLETFAETREIASSELRQITMIVEELFSKIIRSAFENVDDAWLEISLSKSGREIFIEMRFDGDPFNPLEYDPDRVSDPAAIDEGGMGLSLIRAFCDSIHYFREEQGNILQIQKIIHGKSEMDKE